MQKESERAKEHTRAREWVGENTESAKRTPPPQYAQLYRMQSQMAAQARPAGAIEASDSALPFSSFRSVPLSIFPFLFIVSLVLFFHLFFRRLVHLCAIDRHWLCWRPVSLFLFLSVVPLLLLISFSFPHRLSSPLPPLGVHFGAGDQHWLR